MREKEKRCEKEEEKEERDAGGDDGDIGLDKMRCLPLLARCLPLPLLSLHDKQFWLVKRFSLKATFSFSLT